MILLDYNAKHYKNDAKQSAKENRLKKCCSEGILHYSIFSNGFLLKKGLKNFFLSGGKKKYIGKKIREYLFAIRRSILC